jgi:hypothetical protein
MEFSDEVRLDCGIHSQAQTADEDKKGELNGSVDKDKYIMVNIYYHNPRLLNFAGSLLLVVIDLTSAILDRQSTTITHK